MQRLDAGHTLAKIAEGSPDINPAEEFAVLSALTMEQ